MRRAVLLDAHGTLLELESPAPLLQRVLVERHGIAIELGDAHRALRTEIAYYRAHMHEGSDAGTVRALRSRCAEELRRALVPAAPAAAKLSSAEMTDALLASLVFTAFPDVGAGTYILAAGPTPDPSNATTTVTVTLQSSQARTGVTITVEQ